MDSPVKPEEREDLLSRVMANIKSKEDKTFVIDTLTHLFQADGKISDEESAVLQEIQDIVLN